MFTSLSPPMSRRIFVDLSPVWPNDLSAAEVARDTGISQNTLGGYRRGTIVRPNLEVLFTLKSYFEKRLGRKIELETLFRVMNDE